MGEVSGDGSKDKSKRSTNADPFQRFEDLARKLVNVPKQEIDDIDPLVKKKKKPATKQK